MNESIDRRSGIIGQVLVLLILYLLSGSFAFAKDRGDIKLPCCEHEGFQGVVWYGADPKMTIGELAAYCAPIVWFSPDEPLLPKKRGKNIKLPQAFPFEEDPGAPVVYFRIENILVRIDVEGEAFVLDSTGKDNSIIDLHQVGGIDLTYYLYYPSEAGLGGHPHDLEGVEMKLAIVRNNECEQCRYIISVQRVIGKAHGLLWYDNNLITDEFTDFPMHILVEEGKHANCPDKNGDGMYTPGYDVNKRVNDAWGVRDIISTGSLYSGGFQSWMNKLRRPEDRVFPPLPEDSPLREDHSESGEYAPENAIYELRALPRKELALPDHRLEHFIETKGEPDWPVEYADTDVKKFYNWLEKESFVKSLSISFRYDGDVGLSFVFPLLIVKNVEDPIGGGWLVNRIYLKDKGLRDLGYNIIYTTSASRWIDGYFSAGVEFDEEEIDDPNRDTKVFTKFVTESGLKLRLNMVHTPLKFMTKLTDFWGIRIGLKTYGDPFEFEKIGYVFEIGAGTF
jgi:hypothetical protein